MKTLHYSIIAVLFFIILVTLIVEFPIYSGPNALIVLSKPHVEFSNTSHGLPDYNISLVFNGTQTSRDAPFYLKQGQNFTLVVSITSTPTNLPVSLDIDSHVGFTKTNGIDSRLSDTKINTPGQVMIYVSATKDAIPNTYQILVKANNTLMEMNNNFDVKVIPSDENQGHIINTVKNLSPPEWPPCCSPVILSQVELESQFKFLPDNLTCTSQPAVYPQHSCLTNLVPDRKVECSYISGNSCEPLHLYTSGTNKSCFGDSVQSISSGSQWVDLYNTQNKTVQLHYFGFKLISGNDVQQSEGGSFGIGPHEKCTLVLSNNYSQGALEFKPVNMTLEVSYYYDGKPYTTATPSLTDTYNDSETWQFDGNKWVFAEQNTMTVPEFPFVVVTLLVGMVSAIAFYRTKFGK